MKPYVLNTLVSAHFYLFSLTFSLRPDEAAQYGGSKSLSLTNLFIALFLPLRRYHNMDTNKVSNLLTFLIHKIKFGVNAAGDTF